MKSLSNNPPQPLSSLSQTKHLSLYKKNVSTQNTLLVWATGLVLGKLKFFPLHYPLAIPLLPTMLPVLVLLGRACTWLPKGLYSTLSQSHDETEFPESHSLPVWSVDCGAWLLTGALLSCLEQALPIIWLSQPSYFKLVWRWWLCHGVSDVFCWTCDQ